MKNSIQPTNGPSFGQTPNLRTLFEPLLLLLILAITALRATFIELTYQTTPNPLMPLPADVLSVLLSTVLIGSFCLWLAVRLLAPPPDRIAAGLGTAAAVFIMTGIATLFIASHKRDALTDLATLTAPLGTLLMLVELFRKPGRMILALWLLLALGIAAAYQCREQARMDNESTLRDYEKDPQRVLRQIGIEPGTLKHWQFEHRIRSKDVRGFLTTSNSTGSFLLLCLFAALGLLHESLRGPRSSDRVAVMVLYGIAAVILLYGLVLCKSRGAIGAAAACLFGWAVCLAGGKRLWPRRKFLLLAGLVLAVLATGLIIHYGLTHGRLPGPNALLVRWQYWQSTAALIADHPWLGVGGGNFSIVYPLYKNPAAPEMIRDPHNFILSLAAGYGLLGALAFTAVLLGPLLRILLQDRLPKDETDSAFTPSVLIGSLILIATAVVLLWLRPLFSEGTIAEPNLSVRQAYYMVYYLVPAGIITLVLGLLLLAARQPLQMKDCRRYLLPALGWGVGAVLIHNLIDFALFETAVLMALAIVLASVTVLGQSPRPAARYRPAVRFFALGLLTAAFAAFLSVAVIPPVRAGAKIRQAFQYPKQAIDRLEKAEQADWLSPLPAWLQGQWTLQRDSEKLLKEPQALQQAADAFGRAVRRNPLDYRMRESQADVYFVLAERAADPQEKADFQTRAYQIALQAWQRFPGSDRLTFKLGTIAEQLGMEAEAADWYCRAMAIEDSYRRQFEQMYPGYELFSRLGQKRYQHAADYLRKHGPFAAESDNTGPSDDPNQTAP